jgi:hypothetical protein
MIGDNDGTGGGGGGRGGEAGNTMGIGECLFDDDRDDDEYNDDNKTTTQRMGRGCVGKRTMGWNPTTTVAMLSAGCSSGAWGGGH